MIRPSARFFFSLILLSLLTACEHSLPTPPQPAQATLSSIQATIFTPRCAVVGCHVPNGLGPMPLRNTNESFVNLVNTPSIQRPNLMRVQPGDADASYIILKLEGAPGVSGTRMPQGGPFLSSVQINLIRQWINEGALNN
jgi:hypothetical protein